MIGDGEPSISGRRCERLAPARREGKHFANGAAASVALRIRRRPLPALHG